MRVGDSSLNIGGQKHPDTSHTKQKIANLILLQYRIRLKVLINGSITCYNSGHEKISMELLN